MRRRTLLLAAVAGVACVPLRSLAQQPAKLRRVGFLYFGSRESAIETGRYAKFIEGMKEFGYEEGKNLFLEARFADGDDRRVAGLAEDLVRTNPEVIVSAGTQVNHALSRATSTVPVVMVTGDPVGEGLATSLAHPGRNFTGMTGITYELAGKQADLLVGALPGLSRLAVLVNPSNAGHARQLADVEEVARRHGARVLVVKARSPDEIVRAFETMARARSGAVLVFGDTFFVQERRRIAELAYKHKLPSMAQTPDYPEAGLCLSYGRNNRETFKRVAVYVDKILKGAKAANLPIEQPTVLELVINLKTAKAIGFAVPQELLLRADRVIE